MRNKYTIHYENGCIRVMFADSMYQVMSFLMYEREKNGRYIVDISYIEKA